MKSSFFALRLFVVACIFCFLSFPAGAQDEPIARDPAALAARLLGITDPAPLLPPPPTYEIGDTLEFWVAKRDSDTPVRVTAALRAVVPNLYLWVEAGIEEQSGDLRQFAQQTGQVFQALRVRGTYEQNAPALPEDFTDATDLLPLPDVDNDPHIHVLYSADLREDSYFNPLDSLPAVFVPGGYSNERETLYVNTTAFAGVPLSNSLYLLTLIRTYYQFLMTYNNPDQALWLTEALGGSLLLQLQQTGVAPADVGAYLQTPDTSLVRPSTFSTRSPLTGGQQLFLGYLAQRYGTNTFRDLFLQEGLGMGALDTVLAAREMIDPVTGEPVTARHAFADFVLTNLLNGEFGDGRYVHVATELQQNQRVAITALAEHTDAAVSQFGTNYYVYNTRTAGTTTLMFEGDETTARLPMSSERDPADTYYWSGRAHNSNPTLTRTLDLSGIETATLNFDAWYDLAAGWHYGYVSVSTDGGVTWDVLGSDGASSLNTNGVAYGRGFTGISNPEGPRPFPILGVLIQGDGVTLGEVTPNGPADQAGIQPGDVMLGYEGQEWQGAPNIVAVLADYAPGETLNLLIQRGGERLEIPIVLGAHPTRVVQPQPLWQPQTIDLTPYTGGEVLLRFETVTLPGREDNGFAVDNISIPEIEFRDDGSNGEGWTMAGWANVDNRVPQQWLLQVVTTGTQAKPPRVHSLISPSDSGTHSGEWMFALDAGEVLLVAVSGLNDDTIERAVYDLRLE